MRMDSFHGEEIAGGGGGFVYGAEAAVAEDEGGVEAVGGGVDGY